MANINNNESNSTNVPAIDIEEIVKQVKKEVYEEIMRELPKAFEKCLFTIKK